MLRSKNKRKESETIRDWRRHDDYMHCGILGQKNDNSGKSGEI